MNTIQKVAQMLSEAGYFVGMSPDLTVIHLGRDTVVDKTTTIGELIELIENAPEGF